MDESKDKRRNGGGGGVVWKEKTKKKTKILGGENAREEGRLQIGHTLLSWPLQTNSA